MKSPRHRMSSRETHSSLFCIAVRELTDSLRSELNSWYLDDGTLAGMEDSLVVYIQEVKSQGEAFLSWCVATIGPVNV